MGALQRHCGDVVSLGPAGQSFLFAGKVARRGLRLLGRNVDCSHTVILSKALAHIFKRRLARAECDVIFAPVASTELAYLDTQLPVVGYADLTAWLFRNYAAHLTDLSSWSVKQMEDIESRALHRAQRMVYASDWAAQSAISHYGIPAEKITVIPMGANVEDIPDIEQIRELRSARSAGKCRLLFVGVDWERKGGDTALAAMRELRARGVDASLTIVGCAPPTGAADTNLQVIPFLNKAITEQRLRYNDLLLHSDFMVFPTRREAFGVVCCEANAFGLPLIASDGGGVPVWTGENGILLGRDTSGREYADAIQALLNHPDRYLALAISGRRTYESRLNWDSWGCAMAAVFEQAMSKALPTRVPAPLS